MTGRASATEIDIPAEIADQAQEYREKLMDEVAENSDDLMERYLEGEEISHDEIVSALKDGVTAGTIFPVTCGVATKNLGTDRLLDALVQDLPSPAKKGAVKARDGEGNEVEIEPDDDGEPIAYVFKTLADPFAGRINLFRVLSGIVKHDSQLTNVRAHSKERIGQLLVPQRQGDGPRRRVRGRRHRRRREAEGDALRRRARGQGVDDRDAAAGTARRGDGVRGGGEVEGRRGQDRTARSAACRRRTRRSTSTATRRRESRSSRASRRCTSR